MTAGGSVPLQGTVQPLVDGFQSGFFGSADFAQRQQLWNAKNKTQNEPHSFKKCCLNSGREQLIYRYL